MKKLKFITSLMGLIVSLNFISCGSDSNNKSFLAEAQNGEQQTSYSIVGKWETEVSHRDNKYLVNFTFDDEDNFTLRSQKNNNEVESRSGQWSKNGDKIYLYIKGEKGVGVVNILSLDEHSLVIHFDGESEDEIYYFTRSD